MEDDPNSSNLSDLESFILTKYDPLLTIVKELNDSLQNLEKENLRLERRIVNLEQYLLSSKNEDKNTKEKFTLPSEVNLVEDESALSLPWLFSCQAKTPLSALQVLLEFHPDSTIELDISTWLREENMWISLLDELLPILSLSVGSNELEELHSIRRIARKTLLEMSKNEILIVLRNVPGKDEASSNATRITLVAILASAISEAWKRVEQLNPHNMGRVSLVLEGDNIGTRLRAGTKRFRIEPLN
ncbi:conserved hypothetical protein [Theileria equi strain WA]|uniref:Apicomplexan specific coiled coil protein n=1 Tax=Theileria equi strain WA TaxID=1537102 RepID=L1LCV6_THEEQ|nr:conserved hypothetical protein [Theileria equi strain WA]EKX73176.1 conserved hypothetical protein [Theileria equi strain WA]|eukprot:XP_004832628.1 conserved hypothetical protein [Theileria equi strain WA]